VHSAVAAGTAPAPDSERRDGRRHANGRLAGIFPMEPRVILIAIRGPRDGEEEFFDDEGSQQ